MPEAAVDEVWGWLTLAKRFEDEGKQDKSEEEGIQLLVAREDATIAL